jgi:hypothetical protein
MTATAGYIVRERKKEKDLHMKEIFKVNNILKKLLHTGRSRKYM